MGRRFGRSWALAHCDLEVAPGESLLVAGANGSGKTTLLRLLAGLLRPTAGSVEVFELDPRARRLACRRRLSLVSHQAFLYERLSALESLRLWARVLGRRRDDATLGELLEEVGLAARRDSPVATFSAGMRKRLSLARARLEEPDLLLLDEPFAALDVPGQRLVERWIAESLGRGVTVLLASHQLEQAAALCRRAIVLDRGQIEWHGAAADAAARFEART
ncbi:MAG TPA: heme ABC exporter ATP-binding protein CcmA [Thermoanaerobaculia bacterium]|nr:heme ABC exporter ATP-binding protein CcmA [Thermoanaerobaculia bacterium]